MAKSKSKVPQVEPAQNAMVKTDVGDLMPTEATLTGELNAPDQGKFLPTLSMCFPIQIKPNSPFKRGDDYHMGLSNGDQFAKLEAPYTLTVVDARNARRKLVVDAQTKEKSYLRGYQQVERAGQGFDSSADTYNALAADPEGIEGNSFVVAIVKADGSVALANMELFKTQRSYWWPAVMQAFLTSRTGVQVNIADHNENVIEGKSGNTYPGPKKFNQYEVVDLSASQLQAIVDCLKDNEAAYQQWLNK